MSKRVRDPGSSTGEPLVFVSSYYTRHGVAFFDMILRALIAKPRLAGALTRADASLPEPLDQYDLLQQPLGPVPGLARAVLLVPHEKAGPEQRWASTDLRNFDGAGKWEELARSVAREHGRESAVMSWFKAIRDAHPDEQAIALDRALSFKPRGVSGAALWQLINEFALVDQVRWWNEFSPWARRPDFPVTIASIGAPDLLPDDAKGWTQAIEQWVGCQPPNARYLVNLYGTPAHNQLAWYYLAWRLPRLRSSVFCACKTIPWERDRRRFRPIQFERMKKDLIRELERTALPPGLVDSPERQRVRQWLEFYRSAGDNFVILLLGPRGSGKSTTVKAVFGRAAADGTKPSYREANCASFPDPVMAQAHLFGHTAEAFTGARTAHAGLFTEANGGTLFLDEFHMLSKPARELLLTSIQTDADGYFEYRPLGATISLKARFQLILGSNWKIERLYKDFNRDFWDRINQRRHEMPAFDKTRELDKAWHEVWSHMRFGLKDPLTDPDHRERLRDWLADLDYPGSFRDIERLAILAADYQRAEASEILEPIADRGSDPLWFAWLKRRWNEDSAVAQRIDAATESPADSHSAVTSAPGTELVAIDFRRPDAPSPDELVARYRKHIAGLLIRAFENRSRAAAELGKRNVKINATTIGRWERGADAHDADRERKDQEGDLPS